MREKGSGSDQVVHIDARYDMYSLLHYPSTAWSKDNMSETITPINKQYKDIGGTDGMTATDKIELNLRYGCSDIGIPVVIDYIHEVEHRLVMEQENMVMEQQNMKDDFGQRLVIEQQNMEEKLEQRLVVEQQNMEEKLEQRLVVEQQNMAQIWSKD